MSTPSTNSTTSQLFAPLTQQDKNILKVQLQGALGLISIVALDRLFSLSEEIRHGIGAIFILVHIIRTLHSTLSPETHERLYHTAKKVLNHRPL